MMKNIVRRCACIFLVMALACGVTACGVGEGLPGTNTPSPDSSQNGGASVKASLQFAAAEDKILQSYQGDTMTELKERFMGSLVEDCSITAFKNEYETKQLIITPEADVSSYTVSVGDFTCGENKINASSFDVRHMYYHEVSTIFDKQSTMLPGMYPDALLPMETAVAYGRNKIKAGENQGVYITVKVPKDIPAGVYTGKITVNLDGAVSIIDASVTVLDYTLPDTVSMKSCIPTQPGYLFYGELDDTPEMYYKVVDSLKEFRLGAQYLQPYHVMVATDEEAIAFVTDLDTDKAVEATKDPAVGSYAIRCYETPDTVSGQGFGHILNEALLEKYLIAYVNKGMEENVNLFEKAYVYMGNIIDEPDLEGEKGWARANYVCIQYQQTIAKAVAYAQNVGAPQEMIEDLANLQNVVTGAYSARLPEITSYCPTIDIYESSVSRADYVDLREQGKDYWWYTCTIPKIPYPTVHIDDNGVSSRVMSWMAHEYDVTGYLTWESIYYLDQQESVNKVASVVYGIECYDDVHRWGDTYGDGFFFYPGKVFGLDVPVPGMRLYNIRDGLEDFEAMTDLENIYAELSTKYGVELSTDGILQELYGILYDDVKVYSSSADVAKAKELLGQLMVLAMDGIAVSDFEILSNGNVKAKVYAPKTATVTVTGGELSALAECNVYTVSSALNVFSVQSEKAKFTISTEKKLLTTPTDTQRVKVYHGLQGELTSGITKVVNGERLDVTMSAMARSLRYQLDDGLVTAQTDGMQIYVYSSANERIKVSMSLLTDRNTMIPIDTIYLNPGENVIRVDRLYDNNWGRAKSAKSVVFGFELTNQWTLSFENLIVR